jgi:hypothetical protein
MKSSQLFRSISLAFATFALGACGGSQPTAESAPPAGGAEAAPAEAAPASGTPWAEMNKEQRASFMMQVVQPKMKELFQGYDATHFAKFNCSTCHGEGAKNKSFAMPDAAIPKIPATMEGFEKLKAAKPEMVKFMMETVVPEMAKLVNEPIMDPATGKGFGCGECHMKE